MLEVIKFALAISAFYGFGMWLWVFISLTGKRHLVSNRAEIEQFTFRVGLCAIIATGFLGMIITQGG